MPITKPISPTLLRSQSSISDPVCLFLDANRLAQLPIDRFLAQGLAFQIDVRLGMRPMLVVARADVLRVLESLLWSRAA